MSFEPPSDQTPQFDRYHPYAELTSLLHSLVAAYPKLLFIESIGTSFEGRDIWCVTATNAETGPATEKPAFWCDGNIHATEVSPSSALLYLLTKLAKEYGQTDDITRLMDTRALYCVPRVNPDGAEWFFSDKPNYIRSSTRPYPYDEEPLDGLEQQDIDGDGRILQMRIPDSNGPWKQHEEYPRVLVRRSPTEIGGQYYRIMPEGLLKDYDGVNQLVQKKREGLDLNRNFPMQWRPEADQPGAGPFPGSEPEVYSLVRFIAAHPNITGGISFHTHGGLLLRPYGTQADDTMPAEDLWTFQTIGKRGTEITGYPSISVYHDFRYHPKETITGVFDDWMYDHLGLYAWTIEIWAPIRQAGITDYQPIDWYREHPVEDDLKLLAWSDTVLDGRGHVAWYPFEHPQLGEIEIGGWDAIYAFRNPPVALLEKEIAPLADWTIFHALLSPRLVISEAMATAIGDGVYTVRLVVMNEGWLPTYVTKKALERKAARPLVAEIELPAGAVLRSGKLRAEFSQLEGRAYKYASPYGWASDPTDDRTKIEWVVQAVAGQCVTVIARHDRSGTVRRKVTLPDGRSLS